MPWIFESVQLANIEACIATCVFGHEEPLPCELLSWNDTSQTCFMGTHRTNDPSARDAAPLATSPVYFEPGSLEGFINEYYEYQVGASSGVFMLKLYSRVVFIQRAGSR